MGESSRSFESFKKAAIDRFEQEREKIDNAINNIKNGKCQKQRETSPGVEKRRILRPFNEYTFLICILCFSASIVCCKILYANRDNIWGLYVQGKGILFYPFKLSNVELLPKLNSTFAAVWGLILDLSWLFIPALIGIATTYFTWRIVYLDSNIPGVQPASPLSARTLLSQMKSTKMYLMGANGYTFALYIGIIVFLVLLFSWNVVFT